MTSGEPIVDRLLVGRAIVNPLGLSPRQYVARKARDCRRRARELRLQLERQVTDFEILLGDVKRQDFSGIHEAWPMFADIEETRNSLAASETRLLHLARFLGRLWILFSVRCFALLVSSPSYLLRCRSQES